MDWVRQSNSIELTEKKKNQSNPIERSIFELMICVKQELKIHNQILEARVTSARSVADVFFVNEEIPQKWLQMRSKRLPGMPLWRQGWWSFQVFKENRQERPYIPNWKRARTTRSPSTWTGCFPVACNCLNNLVSEDVCKGFNRPGNRSNRNKPGIY